MDRPGEDFVYHEESNEDWELEEDRLIHDWFSLPKVVLGMKNPDFRISPVAIWLYRIIYTSRAILSDLNRSLVSSSFPVDLW